MYTSIYFDQFIYGTFIQTDVQKLFSPVSLNFTVKAVYTCFCVVFL